MNRSDGVRVVATGGVRKSVWWIAAAVAALAAALLVVARLASGPPAVSVVPPAPPPASPPPTAVAEAPVEPRRDEPRAPRSHRARRIEPAVPNAAAPAAEPPAREDAPFSIGPPGSGIALFPSRDTKPIKTGIVVPDDFELPEGYVRHFQANEDGELVAPILLFHPDYEIVDDSGQPIELPPDRVVPPELAPEGLPIQMLEVPRAKGDAR